MRLDSSKISRRKFVAGNWKMHTTAAEAQCLASALTTRVKPVDGVAIAVFPPFPYLAIVGEILRNEVITLGAQNLYPAKAGAFTGEVSPTMLVDLGCKYVILGHSERRAMGESDELINHKVHIGVTAGLDVILCIGETQAERQENQTNQTLERQLTQGLKDLSLDEMKHLTIAYEPIWAIGETGHHATPTQAKEAHAAIRLTIAGMFNEGLAESVSIQYGGSVKPDNAHSLFGQSGVDGALVGGASLNADEFLRIIEAASPSRALQGSSA